MPLFPKNHDEIELMKPSRDKYMKNYDEDGVANYVVRPSYTAKIKAMELIAINKRKSLISKRLKNHFA